MNIKNYSKNRKHRPWNVARLKLNKERYQIPPDLTDTGAFINNVTQFWLKIEPQIHPTHSVTLKWVFYLHLHTYCHKITDSLALLFTWRQLWMPPKTLHRKYKLYQKINFSFFHEKQLKCRWRVLLEANKSILRPFLHNSNSRGHFYTIQFFEAGLFLKLRRL